MEQTTNTLTATQTSARPTVLREILVVGIGYLIYSQVRGLAGDRVFDAFANGRTIVEMERDIGIFKELALQAWIRPHNALVDIFNVIYVYGLFPLLLPTAAWLFVKRPQVYNRARNAFLASGGIAVCFFLLLPTAPPRLMGMGFIDTLGASFTPTYDSIPGVNHFAALPSMHVGWNFLTAVALYMAFSGRRGRELILLLPVVMFTATVVTGNHYILDGVLGLLVAMIGLGLALLIERWSEKRHQRALLQAPSSS